VESGQWCTDREPILKAYAAGLASPDQQRQAEQHLSHCRRCGEFVGRLTGHLHDMGGSIAAPAAAGAITHGRLGLSERLATAFHKARDAATHATGGRAGDGASDAAQSVSAFGTARGAGAASSGALAKLAGVGTAGKLATVCLGGGVAATACVAAGVLPAGIPGLKGAVRQVASERPGHAAGGAANRASAVTVRPAAPPTPPVESTDPEPAPGPRPAPEPAPAEPPPSPSAPIEPSAPAPQQEFGVASAAPSSHGSPATSSSAGGVESRQEFGP
jgi:hypothetical protein